MWLLGRTKPRQEDTARFNLMNQGFEVYLPMIHGDLRQSDKEIEVMFCGYIFINDITGPDWAKVRSTYGMRGLVKFGHHPAVVPDRIIQGLKAYEDENGLHGVLRDYQEGDRVTVRSGPFLDYRAIVKAKGRKRITILLEAAQMEMQVDAKELKLEV